MLTMTGRLQILIVSGGLVLAAPGIAWASGQPPDVGDCPEGTSWNGWACVPDNEDPDGPACNIDGYVFLEELDNRWLRAATDDEADWFRPGGPPLFQGIWEDYPNGWIYHWIRLNGISEPNCGYDEGGWMWLAESPIGPPPVDPEQLAQEILDDFGLEPAEVGIAPTPIDEDPDSMGLVGAPVWMWVENPSPQTWGPITGEASEGGVTVTVTAEADEAVWDMGDGRSHTCVEPGTAYSAEMGVRESPSCGHMYQRTSRGEPDRAYTVSVTTHWTATWEASTGETGTLDVDPLTTSARIRIGERQLIEQG
ncbi:hypothetical protein [Phytoactinopolyspora halotolerans]|uniref:ATP/GTP-binding protein n=1 Tax=Phytoactinopolyspora halotolerans TaxID=1981512 RepID=A0A6L9S7T5_9ACTN|nr:hypothetical protein [Phytoactinopolyspora halotolerans]NEE01169.1 hypothetical protein [Phytoactinopolyspora halotolerans]